MSDFNTAKPPPHFKKEGVFHRLIVDEKAFLILGREVTPSASSSAAYMARQWQDIKNLGLNTVLLAVTWEVFEPKEGRFDRDLVANLIAQARGVGIRVIISWFGSLKGDVSSYTPQWIKMDPVRFPKMRYNIDAWLTVPTPTVSLFGPQLVIAEKTAFAEFVQQVKAADPDYDTILMLQIGSEIGYLDWSRDVCDAALATFDKGVPADYLDFLVQSGSVLCSAESHAWEEFASTSLGTDELFTTYHVASHINALAKIAKEAYPVPIIVNAALEQAEGRKHGGPLPETLHLWKLFAPCIDLYAPRLLDNNYNETCETWGSGSDQPLLVQAHGQWDTASCQLWSAFGSHYAIGIVFSKIQDMSKRHESIIEHSTLLRQAAPFLLDAQDQGHPHIGFTNAHDTRPWLLDPGPLHLISGEFEITLKNSFCLAAWGIMYGLAISQGNGKLLLFGRNFEVKAMSRSDDVASTRILSLHEVEVDEQGRLQVQRTFNADETNGSRIARMSPEAPMIAELQFYCIKK
ncbi:glycoside hydrolase superfamily [Colletotrichum phormii]|uniref:Glycoside hydrolase superfamily n=1 Tax=Colletotrichum phormii TaxID=359342 RepID=A0AAJ0EEE6_9PEZI|nr:glycoside hydrolase superfamily [Colletotrichum phormii]KAK1635738.1 glycoside hydrolase superfamily [Colletotrichum phormii]